MQSLKRLWCEWFGHDYDFVVAEDGEVAMRCNRCGDRIVRAKKKRSKQQARPFKKPIGSELVNKVEKPLKNKRVSKKQKTTEGKRVIKPKKPIASKRVKNE